MRNALALLTLTTLLLNACGKSPEVLQGPKGDAGDKGSNGTDGVNGNDGAACSVVQVVASPALPNGGAILTCGATMVLISNGAPGPTGPTGAPGPAGPVSTYGIVAVLDPCGDAPGIYDEIFLQLANGQVLASFSDNASGQNTRLSLLPPGNYVTTDGSNCHVNVSASGVVIW